jgi:hypothetical protein
MADATPDPPMEDSAAAAPYSATGKSSHRAIPSTKGHSCCLLTVAADSGDARCRRRRRRSRFFGADEWEKRSCEEEEVAYMCRRDGF